MMVAETWAAWTWAVPLGLRAGDEEQRKTLPKGRLRVLIGKACAKLSNLQRVLGTAHICFLALMASWPDREAFFRGSLILCSPVMARMR